jgi:N-acetylneuraminic acid mutarotase
VSVCQQSLLVLVCGLALGVFGDAQGQVTISPGGRTTRPAPRPPLLRSLTDSVSTTGLAPVVLTGAGFGAKQNLVVHWGNLDLSGSELTSVSPTRIVLPAPPHSPGTLWVSVETPLGESNARPVTYVSDGPAPVAFDFTTTAANLHPEMPTCGDWGPDGRLYVGTLSGTIHALTFDDTYTEVGHEVYAGVSALSNHEILGLTFNPFAPTGPGDPVRIHIAHSHLFAQGGGAFTGPSPYPGQVSLLSGPDFNSPQVVVSGLPSSNHDHGVNGLVFDHNGDLLICVGGTTDAGIRHLNIGDLPESPLSGAILKAETSRADFNGAVHYLQRAPPHAPDDDQAHGEDVVVALGSHVTVHASGLRNHFDLVLHSNGHVYATDNGPNPGFGGSSMGPTADGGDVQSPDELVLVEAGEYYGHPNRARGPEDPRQFIYRHSAAPSIPGAYEAPMQELLSSTNGIDEYRATTFRGAMRGELLVQEWSGELARIGLAPGGRQVSFFDDDVTAKPTYSLNLRAGPGGAIVGMHLQGTDINVLLPSDPTALGVTAYDVFPWRAPSPGGTPFVIGGRGFTDIAETQVTFGGVPAVLSSVTAGRIRGLIPAHPSAGTVLHDVVITSGQERSTLTAAFRYLLPAPGMEPGHWTGMPSAPAALGDVALGEIDGSLYLVGMGSAHTLAYDIQSESWEPAGSRAPRPYAGGHHAVEVVDGKLYLFGGLSAGCSGKLQIYDPATDSWSLGADMPWSGGASSTAVIGAFVYVAGGHVNGASTTDACAKYDPALDQWSAPLASMPAARNHAASGTDGQRFWIFGGCGPGSGDLPGVANGFATLQVYDPLSDSWETSDKPASDLSPLPIGRGGMGRAVWFAGEFYVFGGQTRNGPGATDFGVYARVDVYDPLADSWRMEAALPTARHGISPVRTGSRIFVIGGAELSGSSMSPTAEVFTRQ